MILSPSISCSFRTPNAEIEARKGEVHDYDGEFGTLGAFFYDRLNRPAHSLGFLRPEFPSIHAWRTKALACLENTMRRPAQTRIDSTILRDRTEHHGCQREEWHLKTSSGQNIPATVLKPTGAKLRHPAIIALHDMSGMRVFGREKLFADPAEPAYMRTLRSRDYEETPLAEALVKRGYLVIMIDAIGFGERLEGWKYLPDDLLSRRWTFASEQAVKATFQIISAENAAARGAFLAGTTWAGLLAQDDLLTLDFLLERDDVDAEQIGCVGFSFGAYRAHYLAALNPRVKATVSVCWHSTLAGISNNLSGAMGAFSILPGLHDHMDLCDLTTLICPRSLLAISAWQDKLMQPSGAAQAHLNLRRAWDKAHAAERLGSLFFPASHRFDRAMQKAAFRWLDQELNGRDAHSTQNHSATSRENRLPAFHLAAN